MKRSERKSLAKETVEIARRGWYDHPRAGRVSVAEEVAACVAGTRLYLPEDMPRLRREALAGPAGSASAVIEVHDETTLQGVERLLPHAGPEPVAALNFASARNPGGGFLDGSSAQEESLARSSTLYASLTAAPEYYERHRGEPSCLYSDAVILSPACPVFRDDDGNLLDRPRLVTFLSCPAPNAGAVRAPQERARIPEVLRQRAEGVLAVAAVHGLRHLVLGAWGCGVFRNDPDRVAGVFADLLREGGPWLGRFARIVFSVLDPTGGTVGCFRDRLNTGSAEGPFTRGEP